MMKQNLLLIPLLFGLISCETVEENPQKGVFHGLWQGTGEMQTSKKAGRHNCTYISYTLEQSATKFILGKRVFQCDGGWTRMFPALEMSLQGDFLIYQGARVGQITKSDTENKVKVIFDYSPSFVHSMELIEQDGNIYVEETRADVGETWSVHSNLEKNDEAHLKQAVQ